MLIQRVWVRKYILKTYRAKKEAAADCWLETDPGEETLENGGGDIA